MEHVFLFYCVSQLREAVVGLSFADEDFAFDHRCHDIEMAWQVLLPARFVGGHEFAAFRKTRCSLRALAVWPLAARAMARAA